MEKKKKPKKRLASKIFIIFFVSLALIILLVSGIILYKAKTNPDKVPDLFGYKPLIVLTGSMEPTIHTGDLIFAKVKDSKELKEDDVISFRNEENTVTTHRIIEIVDQDGKQYFKTKGDANNTEDLNLVAAEDVEGVYIGRIAKLGSFLMFMHKPMGLFIILLVILVVGLLVLYLVSLKDNKKIRKAEEKDNEEFEEYKRQKRLKENKK